MLGKKASTELIIEGDFSDKPFPLPSLEAALSSALSKRKDLKVVESYGKLADIFISMEKIPLCPTFRLLPQWKTIVKIFPIPAQAIFMDLNFQCLLATLLISQKKFRQSPKEAR